MAQINIDELVFTDDMPQWVTSTMFSVGVESTPALVAYANNWVMNYERAFSEGRTFQPEDFSFAAFIDRNEKDIIELRYDIAGIDDPYGPYGFKIFLDANQVKDLLWKFFERYL